MSCIKCGSERIISISSKSSDLNYFQYNGKEYEGYVVEDIGIGEGGDYIEFSWCLDCGQIQGNFPIEERDFFEDYNENME